ncbi:MAG: ImmA/IrrE family metallo-endopeptidase [Gemmatimonadota bacterium]
MHARRIDPSVAALLAAEPDAEDAVDAIRRRARALIREVQQVATWDGPPFDLTALASYKGFHVETSTLLRSSQEAFIVPGVITLNGNKPPSRRRYSLAHEIGHTLFPDFDDALRQTRKLWRDQSSASRANASDTNVEHLCQVAAAEFLLPEFAFRRLLNADDLSLATVVSLAARFEASIEATCRRSIELTSKRALAIFVQPWDTTKQTFSRGYAPRVPLRVVRAHASPAMGVCDVRPGTPAALTSVVSKAWMRALAPTLGVDIYTATEVWPVSEAGEATDTSFTCEAMVLPYRSPSPCEVIGLFRFP